jgi:hypothetical protein
MDDPEHGEPCARIVHLSLPGGRVIFAECKAPGKKPTELQAKDHERRRALGCEVYVIDSPEAADAFPE